MLKVIKQYNYTCSERTYVIFSPAVQKKKTEDIELAAAIVHSQLIKVNVYLPSLRMKVPDHIQGASRK
jgi:hypothetical protein